MKEVRQRLSSTLMRKMKAVGESFLRGWASWNGALMFYTCLPMPETYATEFRWIAQWVPYVGLVVGGLMAAVDGGLAAAHIPVLVRSALVIAFGLLLTGGLHLDGVMDAADGLALPESMPESMPESELSDCELSDALPSNVQRRLAVMADSRMGAFGGMAAVVLIVLKVLALAAISGHRAFALVAVAMWGRWGQQWAIARYPYLKKAGKGAFHKAALPSVWHTLPSLVVLIGLSGGLMLGGWVSLSLGLRTVGGGIVLSGVVSAYFYRQLGGHTGDTYGAVVEWTEALLLCALTAG